jgi:hypothetical protein
MSIFQSFQTGLAMGQQQRKERDRDTARASASELFKAGNYEGAETGLMTAGLYDEAQAFGSAGERRKAAEKQKTYGETFKTGGWTGLGEMAAGQGDFETAGYAQGQARAKTLQDWEDHDRQITVQKQGVEFLATSAGQLRSLPLEARGQAAMDIIAKSPFADNPQVMQAVQQAAADGRITDDELTAFEEQMLTYAQKLEGQRWQKSFDRGVFEGDRSFEAAEAARRRESQPRNIWQSAGDGVIFNQATGEYQSVAPSGTGSYGGGAGGSGGDPNAFMIPTSSMNDNPFVRMQFGGNLTQGAPSFFDNGEIYTPGAGDITATPGGGRPPNVTESYNRYRSSGLAKNDSKELEAARTEAIAVTTNLKPQIQEMRSLVGTFPMGITSDAQYQIGRVVGDFGGIGMSPEEQGNRDAFLGQSKKLALSLGRDLKPFSNSDRDWIQAMVANPGQTKESAAQVLNTLEKMADYRLFYAQGAEMWQNQYGGLSMTDAKGQNFFESWGEWSAMNPVTGSQFSGDAPTKGTGAKGGVRSGAAGGRGGSGPVRINDDAGYDALPSGAEFIGPDGVRRRKP